MYAPFCFQTPCLEHLEARNCQITEQIMPMLGRALRLGSMLATLHLENCMLAGRPLMILGEAKLVYIFFVVIH